MNQAIRPSQSDRRRKSSYKLCASSPPPEKLSFPFKIYHHQSLACVESVSLTGQINLPSYHFDLLRSPCAEIY